MAAENYLTLMRELSYGEITRQSEERCEYRESLADFPTIPTTATTREIAVEPSYWDADRLVVRIVIGAECFTHNVSVSDIDAVRDYANQFNMVNWSSGVEVAA